MRSNKRQEVWDLVIISIDLKSFYASAEAADRSYDPLTTNLVVADASRTEKTICLAVSPSLKAHGISGRARLFEVVQRVKEVNAERFRKAMALGLLPKGDDGRYHFTASSFDAEALEADPSLELTYIIAPPRMKLYEEISTKIFGIYTNYISPEDIHVYSIDEVFLDVTDYLNTYHMNAHELAGTMIREVLRETGITAAAGIGTNLYLAKIAMDIVAKHVDPDQDGVRIAELDEMKYRELLWCHKPLTDFWRVGKGIAARLEKTGCYTMGDIAGLSEQNEDLLYSLLGINAELLIDHAWGFEPAGIKDIKSYKPEANSISSGQVLMEPYDTEKAKLIVREMTELLVLDLVSKRVVTKQVVLTINYDKTSIEYDHQGRSIADSTFRVTKTGKRYKGKVKPDYYGRIAPEHAHGTGNIDRWTSSARRIMDVMMELYDRIIDPDLLVRRITVAAANVIPEDEIPPEGPEQLSLFVDYTALERKREQEKAADEKERRMQEASLLLKEKFGKNAILKGMNLQEGATTILRNRQIGGHAAGDAGVRSRNQDSAGSESRNQNLDGSRSRNQNVAGSRNRNQEHFSPLSLRGKKDITRGMKDKEPDPRIVYGDIIDHPHYQSPTRPHMSLHDRAAQFAPFAALSGYDDMVREKARIVDDRIEPGDEILEKLNRKLKLLKDAIRGGTSPTVSITYFIPDPLKAGGRYETEVLQIRKIDALRGKVILTKTTGYGNQSAEIDMKDILEIHGEMVDFLDE